ncbi:Peptidoglycan-associated lipoprotein precursor [compost metagenome]
MQLDGHTDERGGTEYNIGLGQRRAETVRQALMRMGVADSQLEAVSFGKEKPASQLQTEEGHQLNRRVEFSYR